MKHGLLRVAALALFSAMLLAAPAAAQEVDEGGAVMLGDDLLLEPGQVVVGDAVILGGDLVMAEGSRLEGDAVVFGGSVTIDGEVTGQVAAVGGSVRLGPTAVVGGDVAAVGGQLDRAEGAVVRGNAVQTNAINFADLPLPPDWSPDVSHPISSAGTSLIKLVKNVVLAVTLAVVLAVIGLLAALLLPRQAEVVGMAVVDAPWTSLGVGFLTHIVAISVVLFLFATCCLFPLGLLVGLAQVVATLFGWAVVGMLVGARLMPKLKRKEPPSVLWNALLGGFVLTLVQTGLMALGPIPCLGILFWILGAILWLLIVSLGVGAVVLSRFGTQRYVVLHPHRERPSALPPQSQFPAGSEPAPAAGVRPDSDVASYDVEAIPGIAADAPPDTGLAPDASSGDLPPTAVAPAEGEVNNSATPEQKETQPPSSDIQS